MGSIDSTNVAMSNSPVGEFKPLEAEEFRKQAHRMVDFIADYYKNVETYPVLSEVEPGYLRKRIPETAPYLPEPLDDIMKDIQKDIIPGMTNWMSPNFYAFFPATVSSAAFLGEMLSTALNSVGFTWVSSPAATELEMIVMDWLAQILKLPKSFMFSGTGGGVIQNTTSESILCTIIAARERALEKLGPDSIGKLVCYGSDQTHTMFPKTCKLAGIYPNNIRLIPTTVETDFGISPQVLRKMVEDDVAAGYVPLFLCATLGTTSTTATDPVDSLSEIANEFGIWIHVDAAYAGSACICPEFRHYLDGIERVDSLSLSPHKWLLAYLDCTCLWVKQPHLLLRALTTNPEYLKNKQSDLDKVVDFKNWQIATGRKFRSLKLWLILRSYGVVNLQSHIRSDVAMGKMFEEWVRSDSRFEIVVPRNFSLVCFRLKPDVSSLHVEEVNKKLLDMLNSTGRVYMTHTIVGGIYMLRLAVGSSLTEEHHVRRVWDLIQKLTDDLLKEA
uniref:Aromatic-L-amino-acid decarboxylase n=1 Tax=Catharanthus roseus TaxID=4058 RepID=TDC_CATRO|nr:RecName: Full=Aromatic-L-amino-acid decarboxylase; Short=AADC; AltName: Full=DOPA decarboxylase; AltName: Full=Tryptophan decarboxylase; Short=CrTDC [Catharanthus roseus]AAA33109.1 tryptophan decarboxylase (EC 4.1.1.28) [Catharanthus roseus]CAA47898.1 tryptophan decarboxylase [Catharanthus roseus]